MSDLADHFFPFDRKERNWLIRRASDGQLFARLGKCLSAFAPGPDLSSGVTWHIDFHIDWLLAGFERGPTKLPRPNPLKDGQRLIRGTNEDFDLVCFAGADIVVVEAKGEGRWKRKRIEEKLRRLSYLAPTGQGSPHPLGGRLFFALTSPQPPSQHCISGYEVWGTLPWVPLDVPQPEDRRRVVRCSEVGADDKDGGFYVVR